MTSATIKPDTGGRHAQGHGYGLVLFASILMVVTKPTSIRSSGLVNPSARRNPPARAIASRNGTAQ